MLDPAELTRLRLEPGGLSSSVAEHFRRSVYLYYREHPRPMPWRETDNPYCILVSEIMLQQTQVCRVLVKYEQFLKDFPSLKALAEASLPHVLTIWSGLGYNRRALALKRCADQVVELLGGELPRTVSELEKLPGIGEYTARAIATFAFGVVTPFIETNIRTVFIHCFFQGRDTVSDAEILPLVVVTIDNENPREWYYALMDYGVMLKQLHPNPGRRSTHHAKQSNFEGSNRQLRSRILQAVLACSGSGGVSAELLAQTLGCDPERVSANLNSMYKEGFLEKQDHRFVVKGNILKG